MNRERKSLLFYGLIKSVEQLTLTVVPRITMSIRAYFHVEGKKKKRKEKETCEDDVFLMEESYRVINLLGDVLTIDYREILFYTKLIAF